MEQELVGRALEYSLVGGAFVYLLIFTVKRLSNMLDKVMDKNTEIVQSMRDISTSQKSIADTLLRMDTRLDLLERRVETLDGGGV